MADLVSDAPLLLLAIVLFVVLSAARELGTFVHGRLTRRAGDPHDDSSDEGFILSAALGLLALLLAFTFGLALSRYEARRELVVAESNAIGTAFMRAQVLDAPERVRLSGLLAAYARTRLAFGLAEQRDKPGYLASSRAQRVEIEMATLDIVRPIRATALGPSLLTATNEVVDLGAAREAALGAVADDCRGGALGVHGDHRADHRLRAGRTKSRHRVATSVLFVLLTIAIWIILDLDRPRRGTIVVSQDPMAQLVKSMPSGPPPAIPHL